MSTIAFYLFAILLLSILGFVMWSGVGAKRRSLGRSFGVLSFAAAGWLALEIYDLVT